MKLFRHCSICGGSAFEDFNGRRGIRCGNCASLERGRLLYSILERRGHLSRDMEVLHFAPEPGLGRRLRDIARRYLAADIDPTRYGRLFPDAERIDLCTDDLARFRGSFDLVVHNHVLEHLPCDVTLVLRRMLACLKPGGRLYFTVPIAPQARTAEDLDPSLSAEVRRQRFGQGDHMRMFGGQDVLSIFQAAGAIEIVDLDQLFCAQELQMMSIPAERSIRGSIFTGTPPS